MNKQEYESRLISLRTDILSALQAIDDIASNYGDDRSCVGKAEVAKAELIAGYLVKAIAVSRG